MAAAGRLSGPEWKRYADPATELEVVRLTDPAFASGMTAPHLRQFTRRSESLLYWSERYAADPPGRTPGLSARSQARGIAAAHRSGRARSVRPCPSLPMNAAFFFSMARSLHEAPLSTRATPRDPRGAGRPPSGRVCGGDGRRDFFLGTRERKIANRERAPRQQARPIVETDQEVEELMARPRHAQILYRAGGQFWLVNSDGSGKRQLKTEPGQTGEALWIPSGRTLIYLHIPEDPKELITLREHAPDEGTDKLLAKTSQFISASPNADASVFTGASRSRASAYVLILLRVARRELTLCEHRASDPAMVQPVFSPDSQNVLFVSDRHGKPAIYQVRVSRFVEETSADAQ